MTEPTIRAIFQDVDGCLNPADGEPISPQPGAALSSSQAQMLESISLAVDSAPIEHFILNTGRPLNLVEGILQHLPTPKARYLLLEHACVLFDRRLNQTVDCKTLAENCGLHHLAARYRRVEAFQQVFEWYQASGQKILEDLHQIAFTPLEKVANLSLEIPLHIDGDHLLSQIEELMQRDLDSSLLQHVQFLRSDRFIDILPDIDKLDGVHLLCAHLEVDLDHALAVGDFLNDLPVFKEFHRVFCPANAHPQIKELTHSKGPSGHVSQKSFGPALVEFLGSLS